METTLFLIIPLIPVFPSGLRLLPALDAGALIVLPAPDLRQDAGLGTAALKALESAVQRLVFLDMNFRHLFSLPPMRPAQSWALCRANPMA